MIARRSSAVAKRLSGSSPPAALDPTETAPQARPLSSALTGSWKDGLGTYYEFNVAGGQISGQFWETGHGRRPIAGNVAGTEKFDFTFTDYGSRHTTFSCNLKSMTQAECSYKASGFLIIPGRSGVTVLTRQ